MTLDEQAKRRDRLLVALLASTLWAKFTETMVEDIWPDLYNEAMEGAELVRGTLGEKATALDWTQLEKNLHAWAVTEAGTLADQLNVTSRKYVEDAVDKYLAAGGEGPLEPYLDGIDSLYRSDLTGALQKVRAMNQGMFQTSEAAGIADDGIWNTSGLSNVCPSCLAMEGRTGKMSELLDTRSTIHSGTDIGCACVITPQIKS